MSAEREPLTPGDGTPAPTRAGLVAAGGLLLALGVVLGAGGTWYAAENGAFNTASTTIDTVALPADEQGDGQDACGSAAGFEWEPMSVTTPAVQGAIGHAFMLLNDAREDCEGGAYPDLPFEASDFEKGVNHTHYVHAHHKFASTCSGETFKLHFYIGGTGEASTTFVVHLHRAFGSVAWTLLKTSPSPCEINAGEAAYPESLSTTGKGVQDQAKFVASELGFQMKMGGCLGEDKNIEVTDIESARSEVEAGLMTELVLFLKVQGSDEDPVETTVTVLEECDLTQSGECVNELKVSPEYAGDVCKIFSEPSAPGQRRRLLEGRALGHTPPDPTELYVARESMFEPRNLRAASERPPLTDRYMKSGPEPPSEWDPRSHECFRKVTVYDQGSCGSCYAQAVGQMMGIRKCLLDHKATGRRLMEKMPNSSRSIVGLADAAPRKTKKGCECKQTWQFEGQTCSDYCCNPDNEPGDWCFVEDESCQGSNWGHCKESVPQPACSDNKLWRDVAGDDCDWYLKHDPGCRKYKDYGQRTHCKIACDACPAANDESTDSNPWHSALLKYMPSISDLAECARGGGGIIRGCDGGNTHSVWNNYLRKSQRGVHVMGEDCLPYDLKCWSSSGVVNPITGGHCSAFKDYYLWHKPCSCIPSTSYPKRYECPSVAPSSSCEFKVPPVAFMVANMGQGLTNAQAVKNMQQHISEYGPIYASFETSAGFMRWDWGRRPIYTGGGAKRGGHAVMAVGWGTTSGTDWWLIRNSWGGGWADRGYCKFQRGINLDNIEASETSAIMPEADIKDYSPPSCRVKSTRSAWSWAGPELKVYTMKAYVVCDEDAKVEMRSSGRGAAPQKDTFSVSGGQVIAREIDLICHGFGLRAGAMSLKLSAKDSTGNVGTAQFSLRVGAVPHLRSVDRSGCGR